MPYPDNFSSARYAAAYERRIVAVEPPLYAATPTDVAALTLVSAQIAALVDTIRETSWSYDSTHIPVWCDVLREFASWSEQMDAARDQAKQSMEEWS